MSDGLNQIILIKSAKYEYAEVDLDGNSLLIGANGSGKTTLLRAILYFYSANSKSLGINPYKKISFSDYYFEYDNSYIVYLYKKEQKHVAVIAYKDNSLKFRFCLFDQKPNIKELFIEENKPLQNGKLWLKLKEVALLSPVVNGAAEYRRILYTNRGHKYAYFTLFYAKEYNSFTKTLSNIFTNSRVDADAIKQVITSSLEVEREIDLEQIKRHLNDFNRIYEDILEFEKSEKKIQSLISSLKKREAILDNIQDTLYSLAFSKPLKEKKLIRYRSDLKNIETQIKELEEEIRKFQQNFLKQKEHLSEKIGYIKGEIKRTKEKEEFYKSIGIEQKIAQFESREELLKEQKRVIEKKEFLTKEHSALKTEHQNRIQAIKNSFIAEQNALDKREFELKSSCAEAIGKIDTKEFKKIGQIKEHYLKQIDMLKEQKLQKSLELQRLKSSLREIEKERFSFLEQELLEQTTKEIESIEQKIAKESAKLQYNIKEIDHLQARFEQKRDALKELFRTKELPLKEELKRYHKLLETDKSSLASQVLTLQNSDKYFYFLKDDILLKNFDITIREEIDQIFALRFNGVTIPKDPLSQKIEMAQDEVVSLQKEYQVKAESLQRWFKNENNKLLREQKDIRERIKSLEIKKSTLKTKIVHLQDLLSKEKERYDTQKEEKIISLKSKIDTLRENLNDLQDSIELLQMEQKKSISSAKSSFTKEKSRINSDFETELKKIDSKREKLELKKAKDIKEQEQNYHLMLQKKGIDIEKLKTIDKELQRLDEKIEQIESLQEVIFGYYKDKKEYLDALPQKRAELKSLQKELEEKELNFEQKNKTLNLKLSTFREELTKLKLSIKEVEDELKKLKRFEEIKLDKFLELKLEYLPQGVEENIETLIDRIENLEIELERGDRSIRERVMRLDVLFDNSLHIKRESDLIDSAYILKEYYQTEKIQEVKEFLNTNLNKNVKNIIGEYSRLLDFQEKVKPRIREISNFFESVDIGVIEKLTLRYLPSNNKVLELFEAIMRENSNNDYGFGINLFNQEDNAKEITKLLKDLADVIERESIESIEFKESFVLEFRVVENGNDSGFVTSLDHIGSNGTDVLIKTMIYIAMLALLKQKVTKRELSLHVILDEIGILSQRYLKELIEFANKNGIFFVNGAPDEKLIGTYKRVYLISNKNNKSYAQELIIQ